MIAQQDDFVAHVAAHAGVPADRAARATHAVLSAIGAYLGDARRQLVADELPAPLGAALLAGGDLALPLLERVLEPGVTAGEARELAASVCRVLVEELSTEAVQAVRDRAPPEWAALLPEPALEARARAAPHGRRETLAAGRPGSRRPLSEAGPHRQVGAVAEENPHGETKLSSTPGSTQERRHETLAEGQPGSGRPLSGARG